MRRSSEEWPGGIMRYKGTSSFQPLLLTWDTLIQSSLDIHGGLGPWGIDLPLMLSICMWSIFVYGYGRMCLYLTSFVWIQHSAWCVANSNFAYWNFLGFFSSIYFWSVIGWIRRSETCRYGGPTIDWLVLLYLLIERDKIEKSGDMFITLGAVFRRS